MGTLFTPHSAQRPSRKFSSALSNSDLQFVPAFRGKQASPSCVSCDSASLGLQFRLFRDAEAELGSENQMIHQIATVEKIQNQKKTLKIYRLF